MICNAHKTVVLFALCLLLLIGITPIAAQDATREAAPIATVEAAPIATHEAAAPVSVDSGGGAVTINTGAAPTTATSPLPLSPGVLSLTVGDVLAIAAGTLALFIAIGKILWDGNQPGESLDTRLTTRIDAVSQDKDYMAALIQAYAAGNQATHKALDSMVSVFQIIAPQTGIKIDDAALALLKQIQSGQTPAKEVIEPGPTSTLSVNLQDGTVTTTTHPAG